MTLALERSATGAPVLSPDLRLLEAELAANPELDKLGLSVRGVCEVLHLNLKPEQPLSDAEVFAQELRGVYTDYDDGDLDFGTVAAPNAGFAVTDARWLDLRRREANREQWPWMHGAGVKVRY